MLACKLLLPSGDTSLVWDTSLVCGHQPHLGTPASSGDTSHVWGHQPRLGTPASSASSVDTSSRLWTPASSAVTSFIWEQRPRLGTPASSWDTSLVWGCQPHLGIQPRLGPPASSASSVDTNLVWGHQPSWHFLHNAGGSKWCHSGTLSKN